MMAGELTVAIGLVWGHIGAMQHEDAYALARACLGLWPGERHLLLLAGFAGVELGYPADLNVLRAAYGLAQGGSGSATGPLASCLDLIKRRQPA
ncbi:hypothetical protein [Pseudoduganella violacea]|uniref:Uncharacterized protein n=1 Tax=Pseudoduganella violacea TaxID=1715466 RepID=A0A7W5BF23_9BURK|nr:hypothetical protein [Pseudoduganella violacea]MBB3121949.1 hypothetical protein [Pseudoduganella violacea]